MTKVYQVTLLVLLFTSLVVSMEDEGFHFAIGNGSYIKHNYMSIEFQIVNIKESKSKLKPQPSKLNYFSTFGGNERRFNQYNDTKFNGFRRFLKSADQGNKDFLNYEKDQYQYEQDEQKNKAHKRKIVKKVMTSFNLRRVIPRECHDEVTFAARFVEMGNSLKNREVKGEVAGQMGINDIILAKMGKLHIKEEEFEKFLEKYGAQLSAGLFREEKEIAVEHKLNQLRNRTPTAGIREHLKGAGKVYISDIFIIRFGC